MSNSWKLSPSIAQLLRERFKEHGPEGLGTTYFPSILWSPGGEIRKGNELVEQLPPYYTLGWLKQADLSRFVSIPNEDFGQVAFNPRSEDAQASNKLIDYVDQKIQIS
jgi:hypothetical protein